MNFSAEPTARRRISRRQSRLRFETLNAFVDTGMADLSRSEPAVWLVLFRDTKRDETDGPTRLHYLKNMIFRIDKIFLGDTSAILVVSLRRFGSITTRPSWC
jgi:hypothetical protein